MNILINTVILAAHKLIIYRNRQIGVTPTLGQMRLRLYEFMIEVNLLAKFVLAEQNFHKNLDSIKNFPCNYRLPTDLCMYV